MRSGSGRVPVAVYLTVFVCLATALTPAPASAQCPTVTWADEFDGSAVDTSKWSFQTGGGGWGNNELQYYRPENASVSGGTLKITADDQRYRGNQYTSTRMRTLGQGDFYFGRFEARIKLTRGRGIWPAFWMMPTDEVYGGWPESGEIDVMENVGHQLTTTHGTIHFGDPWPDNRSTGGSFHLNTGIFADDFHRFAIEKEAGEIRWVVDDVHFLTRTPADVAPDFWPFDERYHFILNVAVGGDWPGSPDATTVFPQVLEVDYVRVYDGFFPSIAGDSLVSHQQPGVVYTVANAPAGSSYSWTVPAGAQVVSGQGTASITVDWGVGGGDVVADVSSACGNDVLTIDVAVEEPYFHDVSFENFDDPANVTVLAERTTGTLTEVANPDPSGVNTSALVGRYVRDASNRYDTLFYVTGSIPDAGRYVDKERKFSVDLYTQAPAGSVFLLQLEDSSVATAGNYPAGRHSRYQVVTSAQGAWQRLEVDYLDSPDPATGDGDVDHVVILFEPDSFTGDTYYFDNFDGYVAGSAGPECGNGVAETGEECDGADLGGATCESLGFDSGTLACGGACAYDTSACVGTCVAAGDGLGCDASANCCSGAGNCSGGKPSSRVCL